MDERWHMYKAIIVDDENIIRRNMKEHIDWQAHDIEMVGDFPTGRKL